MSRIAKVGLVAIALTLGVGATTSTLEASGYIVASSVYGELTCEPGGSEDCGGSESIT